LTLPPTMTTMAMILVLMSLLLLILPNHSFHFTNIRSISKSTSSIGTSTTTTTLFAQLSSLPRGISPFESKSTTLPQEFRSAATKAWNAAVSSATSNSCWEIEFPPLLFQGKSQFDDFDNISELNLNRDWCIEWLPSITKTASSSNTWLVLPDAKECEIAKEEWQGQRYRDAAKFTTIEEATKYYCANTSGGSSNTYTKPWGATVSDGMKQLFAKDAVPASDELMEAPSLHLVCQPGNGGPVEDWINVEQIHNNNNDCPTIIVNGALDKVRDGYYPAVFFPALAQTTNRFYAKPNQVQTLFYLRPLSDKGAYGWLFRVYPEPWQVISQTVVEKNPDKKMVQDQVVYTSDERPSFATALQKIQEAVAV